ncbi:hypothetical protein [Nocardioides sp. SR21]|uniref:hypothetical protein n=1 Tax=Nocardioides sp. SR21 TaxID=2919501 RepID=UPI001FAAD060|nr:hypothetical protein [Nocardioides sp. SR21]
MPASSGSTNEIAGRLTPERPLTRHEVTASDGTLVATLRADNVSSSRIALSLRDDTGALITRDVGTGPLQVSADVPGGDYRLRVRAMDPVDPRGISYTLRTNGEPASNAPTNPPGGPPTNPPTVPPEDPTPEEPTPEEPAPGGSTDNAICGTWVLYQVESVSQLRTLRTKIEDALALPGVVGFSVRFPWDAADMTGTQTTTPLLDEAADIAADSGKALSIRFMAGAHTPQRVFDAGAASYLVNGNPAPLPWSNASGDHQVFLDAYRDYLAKLAAWSKAHDVRLLHLSWYGLDWAELNHGAEVRAAPGYSQSTWLTGHEQLIDVGAQFASKNLTVELPLSGYGPLSGGQSAALADHIAERMGARVDQFAIQANGWDETQEWGSPSAAVENDFDKIWNGPVPTRGLQMIQPDGYDWAKVYDRLATADALYAEVYLPSFWQTPGPSAAYDNNTTARIAQLENEIAAFAKRC